MKFLCRGVDGLTVANAVGAFCSQVTLTEMSLTTYSCSFYLKDDIMLSQCDLKQRLHYDPDTGIFTWKLGVKAGKVAGTLRRVKYGAKRLVIGVKRSQNFAHRLAFLYVTGSFPVGEVDHIDGNGLNNKWNNLREATRQINGRNCKQKSNVSATGESCVYWRADRGYYQVKVRTSLKRVTVSNILTLAEAVTVRNKLWSDNGYHPNHNRKLAGGCCG
jgi:hypothetical protein